MGTVEPLRHVNGGEPHVTKCANCGTPLGNERAVASTPGGPRFFCKHEPGDAPEYSCYLQWQRSRH